MAQKRIKKQMGQFQKAQAMNYFANPTNLNDLYNWQGYILGPDNTPYQGGKFKIRIILPKDYPFKPPKFQFLTPIYHPSINDLGCISIDILCQNWSPALTIQKILITILQLLVDINPYNCLRPQIGKLYQQNIQQFNYFAKQWTQKYAMSLQQQLK